ncbi:hypothetical protein GW755_00535 [bacterium]|nr:hypothetical protein [bacterium]
MSTSLPLRQTESIITPQIPRIFEGEQGWEHTEVVNLSGYTGNDQYLVETNLRPWLGFLAGEATKLVVFPDVSPTQGGIIPTGVAAEFNVEKTPGYLEYFRGADVGCGMYVAALNKDKWSQESFRANPQNLDRLYDLMARHNKEFALGGGNHFLDFSYDIESEEVFVVIHTGSFGDLQLQLGGLYQDPSKYWDTYERTIASAVSNRLKIAAVVQDIFGPVMWSSDTIHNSIDTTSVDNTGHVRVYKGVVQVSDTSKPLILPSSADGLMLLYSAGEGINGEVLYGTSHGTGRRIKRGDAKGDQFISDNSLQVDISGRVHLSQVMLPRQISGIPLTESPVVYHSIDRSEDLMERYSLMGPSARYLQAFAYLGHI